MVSVWQCFKVFLLIAVPVCFVFWLNAEEGQINLVKYMTRETLMKIPEPEPAEKSKSFGGNEDIVSRKSHKKAPLKKVVKLLDRERENAEDHLNDMRAILKQNQDPLPHRKSQLKAKEICGVQNSPCVPKFLALETRIRIAPKHKMMNCIVQKSMSTVMTAAMCFLYNEEAFLEQRGDLYKEWSHYRLCKDKNEYSSVSKVRSQFNISKSMDGWSFSMVTRDPVERFISGYVDRCVRKPLGAIPCNGCKKNMTCFIISEYERMFGQAKERKLKRSFEDVHLFPQNWRCQLKSELKNYHFLRYSADPTDTFLSDFLALAKSQNVSQDSLDFLEQQIAGGRTVHTTVDSPARDFFEKRLRSSPFLMEYIVKMFYYDFLIFKYEFPKGF